ncbi:MAG TPA: type IV toxin-antitoxin system AbiEi family antitoxin domain-containing protein [Dermatophilaceae bacterium]|nr:type IV toxin-antitoxin system AbiEi family antitoxin domain-containing protein [Dermatophilaceae bacterium]
MHPALTIRLATQGGVVTTADAVSCGVQRRDLTRLVRSGALVRVRAGAYVEGIKWQAATETERHGLTAVAVARSFGGRWAVSHCSAVAVHTLPLLARSTEVHLSRLSPGRARSRAGMRAHMAVDPGLTLDVTGVPVVNPSAAVLQAAGAHGVEVGVVAADAAIRRRLATATSLRSTVGLLSLGAGARWAGLAVELADGRSESPGESRTRVILHLGGLPGAEPQVNIYDGARLVGRVDLLFRRERVIVEFDGRLKYSGEDGGAVLYAEKRREDYLRSLGYEVVRLSWADLADPARVIGMVRAAMARTAAR